MGKRLNPTLTFEQYVEVRNEIQALMKPLSEWLQEQPKLPNGTTEPRVMCLVIWKKTFAEWSRLNQLGRELDYHHVTLFKKELRAERAAKFPNRFAE